MDRLTHISITNCIKELDALEKLTISEDYSFQELADLIADISWNLSYVFQRRRYNADECQLLLKKLVKKNKREENEKTLSPSTDWRKDEDADSD